MDWRLYTVTGATTSYLQVSSSSNMAREVQGRLSVKAAQGNIKAKARGKAGGESQEEARRSGSNNNNEWYIFPSILVLCYLYTQLAYF